MDYRWKLGTVYLVGAGPGDPGLITVRGHECLTHADVVVHDRLANHCLLDLAARAEKIDVGKCSNNHPVSQQEINNILIESALQGKMVVRLKGGDPFVFGRGGEEVLALSQAGIPFEVVPGVSSAVAVPAYAGIPVTHRDIAASVAFITGHGAEGRRNLLNWESSAFSADTLVFLMGVHNLPEIVAALLKSGKPADTPVAVIQQGTLPTQKTVTGTLATIGELAQGILPPAITVVGEVVNLRQAARWFDCPQSRPLLGVRVLNTRPIIYEGTPAGMPSAIDEWTCVLNALGAEVFRLPVTHLLTPGKSSALNTAVERIAAAAPGNQPYDWIVFASEPAVAALLGVAEAKGLDGRAFAGISLGVRGVAVAQALRRRGLIPDCDLDCVDRHGQWAGSRILVLHSGTAQAECAVKLRNHGAKVDSVAIYDLLGLNGDAPSLERLVQGNIDVATFFSPAALEGLQKQLETFTHSRPLTETLAPLFVACAGESTALYARDLGVRVDLTAADSTVNSLAEMLVKWHARL